VPLPQTETVLPPLAARLEPLPKLDVRPAPKPKPIPPPHPLMPPAAREPDIAAVSEPASLPVIEAASAIAAVSAVEAQADKSEAAHPLPKHAQLTFYVYQGLSHFQIGTVSQRLEISGDGYTLKAVTQTVGLAKLLKEYQLTQTSRGKVDKQGLRPEIFEEEKVNDNDRPYIKATFDWPLQKLRFSHGGETALPAGAQDMLSIFYHLSQLPMNRDTLPLAVSNGKKLEKYEFEIGPEEEITTPMGKLRALHLRKLHTKGEGGFEIWLGLEYRLLPVKYLLIEPSGEVAGEIVISDIRVADE
jgi:hypothetical protein